MHFFVLHDNVLAASVSVIKQITMPMGLLLVNDVNL